MTPSEAIIEADRAEYTRSMKRGRQSEKLGKLGSAYQWYCRALSFAMDAAEDFETRKRIARVRR